MKRKEPHLPKNNEKVINILNRVAKRVEEATVDINDIKFDLKSMKLRLIGVEHNTSMIKVDVENSREDLKKTETRLNKRITKVGDLITITLAQKTEQLERRVVQLEHLGQAA